LRPSWLTKGHAETDFTPSNLLLRLRGVTDCSEEDVHKYYGLPITDEVVPAPRSQAVGPHAPTYVVQSAVLDDVAKYTIDKLVVVDFGEAFLARDELGSLLTTANGRAHLVDARRLRRHTIPLRRAGVVLWRPSSAAADVWALGCTLYQLRGGIELFEDFLSKTDEMLCQMVRTLGRLPEPLWRAWSARSAYFDDDGRPRDDSNADTTPFPLAAHVDAIGAEMENCLWQPPPPPSAEEAGQLCNLLDTILKMEPEARPAAADILEHEWFRSKA
jgi:serine/threonine protein kinase